MLEFCEEVLDAVTITVDVLVKLGFLGPVGVHSYDGVAASLFHTCPDGIAVIALVHDRRSPWPQIRFQEGFTLIAVGYIGTREDKAQRVAQGVTGKVGLGGEARFGAPHGLGLLSTTGSGRVLMDPRTGAINHEIRVIALERTEVSEHILPETVLRPAPERGIGVLPGTKPSRQIAPRAPGTRDPEHGFNPTAQVGAFASTTMWATQTETMAVNFFSSPQW